MHRSKPCSRVKSSMYRCYVRRPNFCLVVLSGVTCSSCKAMCRPVYRAFCRPPKVEGRTYCPSLLDTPRLRSRAVWGLRTHSLSSLRRLKSSTNRPMAALAPHIPEKTLLLHRISRTSLCSCHVCHCTPPESPRRLDSRTQPSFVCRAELLLRASGSGVSSHSRPALVAYKRSPILR
jgi:hypothetical protein